VGRRLVVSFCGQSASVLDTSIQQPGFDLPRQSWTLLNRFQTDQGLCHANFHKCSLVASELCDCGQRQTMGHIVDSCPLIQLDGGLPRLQEADDDVVSWLKTTAAMLNSTRQMRLLCSAITLCFVNCF